MANNQVLIENLERLMAEKGFNNLSLAKEAGLSHTGVRDIFLGKSQDPKPGTIQKLADALDVPVYELTLKQEQRQQVKIIAEMTDDFSDQELKSVAAFVHTLKSMRSAGS